MLHILVVAAALAAASPELKHFENFAENPSFEADRNRDAGPDGWRALAFESPAQFVWDSAVARTGRHSVAIRDSFRADPQGDWKRTTGRWVSASRVIEPGTEYSLEFWIKTEDVSGTAYAHLAWLRDTRWVSEVATQRLSGTTDWQKVTVTTIAPANANAVIVSLNLSQSKGTAWFDDVKVAGKSDELPHVEYVFNDTESWFPFEIPWNDTNLDSIDLTELLDAPAGNHGFVTVRPDGHFYFEDGKRARFFGTNVGGRECAPDKKDAPVIAARLAKYGVNMLRLHSMDSLYGPLIDYSQGTSQQFDETGLDRIDFFVSQLKKRGIYVYLDLLDYRQFLTADGVKHGDEFTHNWQGSMKGASIFDERMVELQKDYATKLLTHRNPYTGLRYLDDPAIAVVETTNENSIFYFFNMSGLSLPYYRDALTKRWNQWLETQYPARQQLMAAWTNDDGQCALRPDEDAGKENVELSFGLLGSYRPAASGKPDNPLLQPRRVRDMLRFFVEIQRHYYEQMQRHLKQLGVRVPVAGTNQQFVVIDTHVDATMNDFMSRNQYWRHPHRNAKPFFKFANEPLVGVDIPSVRNPLAVIARTSVAGKPQGVAEFNFPWPNEYRCEGLLMAAAYSCLQDWDMFLLFSYGHDEELSMFRSRSDPARWGEFPAAALMFHRHDVSAARNEVHVVQTQADALTLQPHTTNAPYTVYRFLTFISKVRNVFTDGPHHSDADVALATGLSADAVIEGKAKVVRLAAQPWEEWLYPQFVAAVQPWDLPGYDTMDTEVSRLDSDTGELSLDYGVGRLTINTPRTKSAIGYLSKTGSIDLDGMQLRCTNDFAAITATSLDGQSIGLSRHLLVTAVARAENTGQGFWPPTPEQSRWSPTVWMLPAEGRPPVIAQPVDAQLLLNVPGTARVYALDATGRRTHELDARTTDGVVQFSLRPARSIWCELVVTQTPREF